MAKPKQDAAPAAGHNSTDEEAANKRALLLTHIADIRRERAALDEIKAEATAQSKELGDRFRLAKVELGKTYSRKFIEQEILAPLDRMRQGGQREFDEERAFARETFGFPNGPQGELFAQATDTERDRERWTADGRLAGQQGLEREAPEGCPSIFVGDWEHAWADGQRDLAQAWETRNRLNAEAKAAEGPALDPEPEEEFDAEGAARKLKGKGFLDTTAPEVDAEPKLQAAE